VYESGLAKEPTSRVDQNKNICKLKLPELAEIAPEHYVLNKCDGHC